MGVLEDEFPEVYRFNVAVFPSEDDDVITSPYNSLLSLSKASPVHVAKGAPGVNLGHISLRNSVPWEVLRIFPPAARRAFGLRLSRGEPGADGHLCSYRRGGPAARREERCGTRRTSGRRARVSGAALTEEVEWRQCWRWRECCMLHGNALHVCEGERRVPHHSYPGPYTQDAGEAL